MNIGDHVICNLKEKMEAGGSGVEQPRSQEFSLVTREKLWERGCGLKRKPSDTPVIQR